MNMELKELISKLEEGLTLFESDLLLLKANGEAVGSDVIEENGSGYYTYRDVFKVGSRYFAITWSVHPHNGRSVFDEIVEAEEVKPIEKQITITDYVSIYQ